MTTVDYRDFAIDCLGWAAERSDASQRQTIIGVARQWMATALMLEEGAEMLRDPSAISSELRGKLD